MDREPSTNSAPGAGRASPRSKPLDWAQLAGQAEPVARAIEGYVRRRRRRRITAAATAGVLLLVGAIGWRGYRADGGAMPAREAGSASVLVSAPQRQTLPDGTIVELNAGAEIAVDFTATSAGPRRVVLARGEAHFAVAKNPQRPFIVAVNGVDVRAVGTAFAVQRSETSVEIVVTEGRVAVDRSDVRSATATVTASETISGGAAAPIASEPLALVDAGNRAFVATDRPVTEARVEAVSVPELEERLSWRIPRLEFNATPLVEVVAMFNRQPTRRADAPALSLVLADPELQPLPLSGTLRADNVAVLLQILDSSYGITSERRPNGEIVLRKAAK